MSNGGPEVYRARRNALREAIGGGVLFFLGHLPQPRNYRDNIYPFRQNSHLLYYTGLSVPHLALLMFPDADNDILFTWPETLDDIVWSGPGERPIDLARRAGLEMIEDIARLGVYLTKTRASRQEIHYLPPYQDTSLFRLAELLVVDPSEVSAGASELLAEAVCRQRSIKSAEEVALVEAALEVSDRMHRAGMSEGRAGRFEYEVAGAIQAVALARNCVQAYNPIVTVHGEVLHNHLYDNRLADGDLMLIDAGAESPSGYASDITRAFPVAGRFTSQQAEIYEVVLKTQLAAIALARPGVTYRSVHLDAARVMVEGLHAVGLMRGNPDAAVEAGAHALFFPHGLGHMLGLDVHDLEDLGDVVGYTKEEKRSPQFGLNFLRLARPLEAGFVLTVEPGIYFIPALIDRWQQEGRHRDFIEYNRLAAYRSFGGIRIEDDVLITSTGARVLGPPIPKTVAEVEAAAAR